MRDIGRKGFMERRFEMSRRGFLGAAAALGATALASCATNSADSSMAAAPRSSERGEFLIKGAHLLTMDAQLGEIPGGDVHIRNGAILAVGRNLTAPAAEIIRADDMIALPGFIETH